MKRQRTFFCIIVIGLLFLLSGCVNLEQDMTVREDGSGSVRFALGVEAASYDLFQEQTPDGYQLADLLSSLRLNEQVVDVREEHYEEGDMIWDSIELEVTDIAVLFAADQRIGPVTIALDEEDGVYSFEQVIDVANSTLTIPGIHLLDLADVGYTIRLNTPQILETSGLRETAGGSTWEVSVSDLLVEGDAITLYADYVLEPYEGRFIPWEIYYPYVVAGFLGVGLLTILLVIVLNTRKKSNNGQRKITYK